MQFHDYLTHYQVFKHRDRKHPWVTGGVEAFYQGYLQTLSEQARLRYGRRLEDYDPFSPMLLQLEQDWHAKDRPYYNLWPSIIPALTKLKMDADASFFRLPLDEILLRFPKANNPLTWVDKNGKEWSVRTVLAQNVMLHSSDSTKTKVVYYRGNLPGNSKRGIAFWLDIGEPVDCDPKKPDDAAGQLHTLLYKHLVCEDGRTIEWSFDDIPAHESSALGVEYPNHIVRDVAKLVCTLCLMADEPELVEPIVLKADEEKFDRTGDMGLVEKAKRRGNFGFNVGRDIEVAPHVRSASPAALYWTGEGRKIPRIRFRRGTVVHRKRLASMPTGYLDKEGETE